MMDAGTKMIVLDSPTQSFLEELRKLRAKLGLTQRQLAATVKIPRNTYQNYELKRNYPTLGTLNHLAELLGYDLSESVNYKYYHKSPSSLELKERLTRYGLSLLELSKLTGYDMIHIYFTVRMQSRGSVSCYAAVLNVLKSEQESEEFRRRYCMPFEKGEALGLDWLKKEYLTRQEVAASYGVDVQTVTQWVRQGKCPKPRLISGKKYWSKTELQEYEKVRQ